MINEPTPTGKSAPRARLTLSDIVSQLLERSGGEHSSVTLSRNAKGATQIEVVVRTGDGEAPSTVTQAEAIAVEVYERLRTLYPDDPQTGGVSNGS